MGYYSVYIMFNCMHILRKTSFQIFDAQWYTHTHIRDGKRRRKKK